jgi:UDP-glucose 4-epimerase
MAAAEGYHLGSLLDKRILVTGGAGFVGSHIVDLLVGEGCRSIVAVDNFVRGSPANLTEALAHPEVTLVEGDIRDRGLMRALVGGADMVFHQAALRITQCAAEPREAFEVMAEATFELARMCADAGTEKIVYASSASIYGMAEAFPTDERHHGHADRTLYGAAKTFGEGVLRALGVPHIALRYFNVYGPRMDVHGRHTEVLVRWMERIEAGLPPLIFGDGAQTMDFVHVRDVARANLLAATRAPSGEANDGAFNVASGTETSLAALAQVLAEVMGRPALTPAFEAAREVNSVERRLANVEKARRLLGFAAEIPLREGLRDLVEWWRTQRTAAAAAAE